MVELNDATSPARSRKLGLLGVLGCVAALLGVLLLVDAASMKTTVAVEPSSSEAIAALANGVDPLVRQVPDASLVGKQIVSAVAGGASLIAGVFLFCRRR